MIEGVAGARDFVAANTAIEAPPLVPEVRLHVATEMLPLWQLTEAELAATGLPPPYWAFAWAGGQALARYVLDQPELVRGRTIADFGAGSGLVAIAAALAGAKSVTAIEIDRNAREAIRLNARLNGCYIADATDIDDIDPPPEVVLAADVFYEAPLAGLATELLTAAARRSATVLVGDPGRTYLPKDRLRSLAEYRVETPRALEDSDLCLTRVWQFN